VRQCFKKRDQRDTNCIFVELAGFYTLETESVGSGQGPKSGIIGGKLSNCKYLIFPRKETTCFAGVQTYQTEKGDSKRDIFDGRSLSINE